MHSDSSSEELRFLVEQIYSNEQLNNTAFYWVGQTSDSNRFQLSIPHSGTETRTLPTLLGVIFVFIDRSRLGQLLTRDALYLFFVSLVDAVQQCPSLRIWSSLINATLNMEPCGSSGGYICEKIVKSNYLKQLLCKLLHLCVTTNCWFTLCTFRFVRFVPYVQTLAYCSVL